MEAAKDSGLIIGKGGLFGNVLRISPALNVTKADADQAADIIDQALAERREGQVSMFRAGREASGGLRLPAAAGADRPSERPEMDCKTSPTSSASAPSSSPTPPTSPCAPPATASCIS